MSEEIFKVIGALGLISLIIGTLMLSNKKVKKKKVYPFLLVGGILLAIYSFFIEDIIFIILQIFYVATVAYDIFELAKNKDSKNTLTKKKEAGKKRSNKKTSKKSNKKNSNKK